ncbi:hypothetical protein ACL02U_32435 [Streptomyces sp. MS06]|uniref:hypothetical protein n=1 Tax=Streptomyces sp. MS06 TaxID=3385974 RepID=UPI0039A3171D
MHAPERTITVAVALLALSLSACSSSGSASDSSDSAKPPVDRSKWPQAVPRTGLVKGLTLPLEAYLPSYADTVAVDQARTDLQEQCMADYGLSVSLPRAGANPSISDNSIDIERRYGITDRAAAGRRGYLLTPDQQKSTEQKTPELSDAEVEVLTGHTKPKPAAAPTGGHGTDFVGRGKTQPARAEYNGKKLRKGGCTGWSRSKFPPVSELSRLADTLAAQSLTSSRDEHGVKKAMKEWSGCMEKAGYDVANPYAAMEKGLSKDHGTTASKAQIDIALADVDCKRKSDLIKIWSDAEAAIQKKLIKENKVELTKNKNTFAALVKSAHARQTNYR